VLAVGGSWLLDAAGEEVGEAESMSAVARFIVGDDGRAE
jgi:hypothetical protein